MTKISEFYWYQRPSKFLYRFVIKRIVNFFGRKSSSSAGRGAVSLPAGRGGVRDASRDLVVQMWGGFAKDAAPKLHGIAKDRRFTKKDRAFVAWELLRYYLFCGELDNFGEMRDVLHSQDRSLSLSLKTKLMSIEYHSARKEFDAAIEVAQYVIDHRSVEEAANFHLSMSNIMLVKLGTDESSAELDDLRLGCMNTVFRAQELSEIKLIEPGHGFHFGNLACVEPVVASDPLFNSKLISVLMPVYNAAEHIEGSLGSILCQTWSNIEIIVVDDCSIDDSLAIVRKIAESDPRIKVYSNECNRGAYETRNHALRESTGELITVHDSDDWSHAQMLELQALALLKHASAKATCSMMIRATSDMYYSLRPQRRNLEYIHRSYPSLLLRRETLNELGCWDGVCANADDEFFQRLNVLHGKDAIIDILPSVPLSFFLKHSGSLTESPDHHLSSLTFGVRHEYSCQARYWRSKRAGESLAINGRTSMKSPFPIPHKLAPNDWKLNMHYDLVIISDLGLLGGTRRCNEGYIQAALEDGLRVALFHWPRHDLRYTEISDAYRELSYNENVDIIVHEDRISADLVLIHHPPILNYTLDSLPVIDTKQVAILVNQLPMQLKSSQPHYYDMVKSEDFLKSWLSVSEVAWLAISGLVRESLQRLNPAGIVAESIWSPPYIGSALESRKSRNSANSCPSSNIIVGRHSRDHWTKWPEQKDDILAAYCGATDIEVQLLGGVKHALKKVGSAPSNWTIHEFDSLSVDEFLSGLDFFVHFTHEDYIEEFGRNVMEAMACGIPVLLPHSFRETFGDAAIYCEPNEVYDNILKLWKDEDLYEHYSKLGVLFVRNNCILDVVKAKMQQLLPN